MFSVLMTQLRDRRTCDHGLTIVVTQQRSPRSVISDQSYSLTAPNVSPFDDP
jgi:hypothetical protein